LSPSEAPPDVSRRKDEPPSISSHRQSLFSLIDRIIAGEISQVIIAHKDRLAPFGFDLMAHLCKQQQCELLVLNTESLSPDQELVQDLMTILHCFSRRVYGLRNYRNALEEALAHGSDTDHQPQDPAQPDA